jgi:hypothetical protein
LALLTPKRGAARGSFREAPRDGDLADGRRFEGVGMLGRYPIFAVRATGRQQLTVSFKA